MKNKFVLILVCLLFLPMVFAADIGYVVDGSADSNIVGIINGLGYSYDVLDGDDLSGVNFNNYNMLIIGDGKFSDYQDVPVGSVNSLVINGQSSYLDYWGISDYSNLLTSNDYESGSVILNHEITSGLIGSVDLYNNRDAKIYFLPYAYQGRALDFKRLIIGDNNDRACVGFINSGGRLYGGGTSSSKIVFFGIVESDYWTSESSLMFSKSVNWLMGNANHAPTFNGNLEVVEWGKGGSVSIDLDNYFEDVDGDDLYYSIEDTSEEDEINAIISGSIIRFESLGDFVGEDWIVLKAEDSSGAYDLSDEIVLRVLETFVGGLAITSYSPNTGDVNILNGNTKDFSVVISDTNEDVKWFIDGSLVGTGFNYVFNRGLGSYELIAVVGNEVPELFNKWDVLVGVVSDFTCSEIGGNICSSNQICSEDYLDVSNSDVCCPVACSAKPLEFNDIDREVLTSEIKVEITDPDDGEEFNFGDSIRLKLDIDNDADNDLDFDIKVYLYDLTEDEVVEDYDYNIDIDEGSSRIFAADIEIPYDLIDDDDYAFFVQINDDDEEYFAEDYIKLNLNREASQILIDKIEVVESIECGNFLNVEIKLVNIGSDEQDVYFKIENPVLKIDEKTDVFQLEEYGQKDSITKKFSFKIPNDVVPAAYGLKVSVYFGSEKVIGEKQIAVGCENYEMNLNDVESIGLNGENSEAVVSEEGISGVFIFVLVVMFILIIGLVSSFVYIKFFRV